MKDKVLITVALKIEFQGKIPENCEIIYTGVGKVNAAYNLTKKLESMNKLKTTKNIIIEDSPYGIEAGIETGEFVIAVDRGVFTKEQLSKANIIVKKITPEIILNISETL